MKRNIIIIACVMLLAFLLGLAGLSLAQSGTADVLGKDRLIGVFITTEYLDLFDMESYFNDNIGKMTTGGDITIDGDSPKYQGRLYATLKDRSHKNYHCFCPCIEVGFIKHKQEYPHF